MPKRTAFPATPRKAAWAKWLVLVRGLTQTHAAILVGLNSGTVCHIINGRRFSEVKPQPWPGAL